MANAGQGSGGGGRERELGIWDCGIFPLVREQGYCLSVLGSALLFSWPLWGAPRNPQTDTPTALASAQCCVLLLIAAKFLMKAVPLPPLCSV